MDEDDYTSEPLPACQMQGIDVVILVADCISTFWNGMTILLMKHANWRVEQKRFVREAGMELERLVSGE